MSIGSYLPGPGFYLSVQTFSYLFSYSKIVRLDLEATKSYFQATGLDASGLGLYSAGPTVSYFRPEYASGATLRAGIGAGTALGITAISL